MYYQVLVEIKEKIGKSNQNKEITVLDVESRDEVLNDIVIPYLNNEEFVFNGYMLNKREINRLKVMTTEQTVRSLSQYENDNMPQGLIMYVSPNDILTYDKYITDVTKELLDEGKKTQHTILDRHKDEIIGNYPISDDFCLYYVIDKNKDDDRIEILGFYSLYFNDFSEHIGENKEIKSILIGQRNLDEDDFTKAVVDLYEF